MGCWQPHMGSNSFLGDANIGQEDLPTASESRSTRAVRAGGPQASAMAALGRKRLYYGRRKWEGGLRNLGNCLTLLNQHKSRIILLPSGELCGCKTGMSGETGSTSYWRCVSKKHFELFRLCHTDIYHHNCFLWLFLFLVHCKLFYTDTQYYL